MNFNKKQAAMLIVALFMAWVGNVYWYNHNLLKEPLFVKCYYDSPGDMPVFRYIQNATDDYSIICMSFPELDNVYVQCSEFERERNKYYKIKEITSSYDVKKVTKGKAAMVTKAKVFFTNGKSMIVDIGEVYLSPNINDKPLLKYNSGCVYNNNEGSVVAIASGNGVIKGIKDKFSINLSDIVKIELNGKRVNATEFPIEFKSGDTITVNYHFYFKGENDIRGSYFYKLSSLIDCEDMNGKKSDEFIDVEYCPDINKIDVKKLEKEKGGN